MIFQKAKERSDIQTMFLDVMPDILDRFFGSGVVEEMRLEQKPFHSDEGEMVVFKD